MSKDDFRAELLRLPHTLQRSWHKRQLLFAARALGRTRHILGSSCQPQDLVSETVTRILVGGGAYTQKKTDRSADLFFGRCMFATLGSMIEHHLAKKRRFDCGSYLELDDSSLSEGVDTICAAPLGPEELLYQYCDRARAQKIIEGLQNKCAGSLWLYLKNLTRYADDKSTQEEIALDLGVTQGYLRKIRERARDLMIAKGFIDASNVISRVSARKR
jgi:hypothetical protein